MTNKAWLVLVVYLFLATVLTHPLWLHLAEAVPSDIGDPLLNAWVLAWDAHAWLNPSIHWFDANIFFPLPNTLAYSEHMASVAALVLPIQVISQEPLVAYNASMLLSFGLAGMGMYLLIRRWTGSGAAAWVAGLAFAFGPYRLAAISHLQLLSVQWLPFSLLALDCLLDPGRRTRAWRSVLLLVLFTTLQVLASWYLAVFTLLVLACYALSWMVTALVVRHRPPDGQRVFQQLGWLALSAGLVILLSLPMAWPYLEVMPTLQAARPLEESLKLAAQPGDFLAAAPVLRLFGPLSQPLRQRPGFTEENLLWLGTAAPLLTLLGLACIWRPGAGAFRTGLHRWRSGALLLILVISLLLTTAGPYQALVQLVPWLSVIRVPARWVIPATCALAGLAGYGIAGARQLLAGRGQHTPGWRRALAAALPAIIGLWLLAETWAVPIPLAEVGARASWPAVYHILRQSAIDRRPADQAATPGWAVVELPMYVAPGPEYPETRRMLASSLGWWQLVNGYSGFTPARQPLLGQALADFPSERAITTLRELGGAGVCYLVVHSQQAPFETATWRDQLRWQVEHQTSLLTLGDWQGDYLYQINSYGDELITRPEVVNDPCWVARRPIGWGGYFDSSVGPVYLLAYLIGPDAGRETSEQLLRLTLYWRTGQPLTEDYTVFVHALDTNGQLIGQADGPPVMGHYPTRSWLPGELVQDSRLVPAAAQYLVGLYALATGERLPAFGPAGQRLTGDALRLVVEP